MVMVGLPIIENLIAGLLMGSFYALMAVGLTLIFGVMRIVNFAHGELYMLGGYILYYLATLFGLNNFIALPIVIGIMFIVGVVIEKTLLRPIIVEKLGDEYSIIITFGLSLFLVNFAIAFFGPEYKSPPPYVQAYRVQLGPISISGDRLLVASIAVVILVIAYLIISKTRVGLAMRAAAQNREGAMLCGIDIYKVNMFTMGLASALAGAAGALLSTIMLLYPQAGLIPAIKSYVIIALGGMGSLIGAVVGSVILGIVESLGTVLLSAAYRDAYSFLVLILVLLLRPQGLFGVRVREV